MNTIERVARAICYAGGNCAGKCQETTGHCRALTENLIGEFGAKGHLARAAIAAMREPSEAMLDKGPLEPYMDRDVWARMIDAALAEGVGE